MNFFVVPLSEDVLVDVTPAIVVSNAKIVLLACFAGIDSLTTCQLRMCCAESQ